MCVERGDERGKEGREVLVPKGRKESEGARKSLDETNWRVRHSKAQLERRHVVLSLSRGWHMENSGVESGVLGGRGRGRRNMKGGWRDERKD